jgi:N-acetylglucosaminyldiphosphoundecaprenol N-acetyl-beta-D-mannosaminyltransferase
MKKNSRGLGRNHVTIFKINLDSTSKDKVLRSIREKLKDFDKKSRKYSPFLIVTPNPENVTRAISDPVLKKIINEAEYSIPDGVGLAQAAKFMSFKNPKNRFIRLLVHLAEGLIVGLATLVKPGWLTTEITLIKGRILFMDLIKLANKKNWRVFFLGDRDHSAQKAQKVLEKSYKKIEIYSHDGPNLNNSALPISSEDREIEAKAVNFINKVKPHLLFVGFGCPRQEKWMYKYKNKLKIGGAMGFGSTFDFVSGKSKTPPAWMENLGLEWIWRLLSGSTNLKRIFTAFPLFPLKVFWYKFTSKVA